MRNETSSSTFAQGYGGQASKSSLVFCEDVPASFYYAVARKKRLRLLSEVVLRTVKRRLPSSPYGLRRDKCVFVRHFFDKKNGGERGIRTLGDLRLGGFQDRCLKPLDHLSGFAKLLSDAFEHQFCHVLYKSCRVFNRTAF